MSCYGQCPRCGHWSLEHLETHSHCWECLYFPEDNPVLDYMDKLEQAQLPVEEFMDAEMIKVLECKAPDPFLELE